MVVSCVDSKFIIGLLLVFILVEWEGFIFVERLVLLVNILGWDFELVIVSLLICVLLFVLILGEYWNLFLSGLL